MRESESSPFRVAIVGGGYAGFAAAVELASQGTQVQLFEAGPVLGGRARRITYRDLALDNGAHILLGAYRETLRLQGTVGVPASALLRLPLQWVIKDRLKIHTAGLPAPLHLLAGLFSAAGLTFGECLAAAKFMMAMRRTNFRLSSDITVAALLEMHRQQGALARYLWEPLCVAALNTPPEQASAQVFLNVLRDGLAQGEADSDLLLPRLDFSRLFPEKAADYLTQKGGQVLTLSPVSRVETTPRGFAIAVKGETHSADAVILAVGPHQAAGLLSPIRGTDSLVACINRLAYEPICTVYLQYADSIALPSPMLGLAGGLVQWVFDREALYGQRGLLAAVMSVAGAHAAIANDDVARTIAAEIANHFPCFGKPLWSKVILEKFATFACTPGLQRPAQKTPVQRLYLAGDYTAGDYPATLEGAVRSGVKCAQLLLAEAH